MRSFIYGTLFGPRERFVHDCKCYSITNPRHEVECQNESLENRVLIYVGTYVHVHMNSLNAVISPKSACLCARATRLALVDISQFFVPRAYIINDKGLGVHYGSAEIISTASFLSVFSLSLLSPPSRRKPTATFSRPGIAAARYSPALNSENFNKAPSVPLCPHPREIQ